MTEKLNIKFNHTLNQFQIAVSRKAFAAEMQELWLDFREKPEVKKPSFGPSF